MSLFGTLFGTGQHSVMQEIRTALDLVTHTGGLASNPADIDPLLDKVRAITATKSIEEGLSPADEETLFGVYLGLENYLATRDPIRTYTKEELRSRINEDLLSKLTKYETKGGI
jgi:hypothetical protein